MKTGIEHLNLSSAETWLERFESYAMIQSVEKVDSTTELTQEQKQEQKKQRAAYKKALLIASMGPEAYEIVRNHILPKKIESATYEELVKQITTIAVTPNTLTEGIELQSLRQRKDESDVEWLSRVKSKAMKGNFGASFDLVVRNVFVSGLCAHEKRSHVLQKLKNEATSAEALQEAARFIELDIKVNAVWNKKGPNRHSGSSSRAAGGPSNSSNQRPERTKSYSCFVCRGPHLKRECPRRNEKCPHCGKCGHLPERCWKKNNVRQIEENQVDSVFAVNSSDRAKTTITVDEVPVQFEIDTGASVTTMSLTDYKSRFREYIPDEQTVRCANGSTAVVLGRRDAVMEHNGKKANVTIKIMEDPFPNLLGRDGLSSLFGDWENRLFDVSFVTASPEDCGKS